MGRGGRDRRQWGRAHLVFLGLVGGRYVSQILDHLLGVFSFTGTRLSSVEGEGERSTNHFWGGKRNKTGFNVVTRDYFFNK